MFKFFFAISVILLLQVLTISAQINIKTNELCSLMTYEDHNFLPPERLLVSKVSGQVVLRTSRIPIREACIGIFDEKTKELIKVTLSKKRGRFSFEGVKEGKYRIIVFDATLFVCTANIPIQVQANNKGKILINMVAKGTDECSYGKLLKK